MNIGWLWGLLAILVVLDLLFIVLRASYVNVRIPQLLSLGNQNEPKSLDDVLILLNRPSLRVGLRVAINLTHFLLAVTVFLLLQVYFPLAAAGVLLLGVAIAALIWVAVEFIIEGLMSVDPEPRFIKLVPVVRSVDLLLRPLSVLYVPLLGHKENSDHTPGLVTDDELKNWVEAGESTGGLEKGERQMIYSIFHFGDTFCREIMVPRIDIMALEADITVDQAIQQLSSSGHSRVPVYDDQIDNIVGLLYAKDLLKTKLEKGSAQTIRGFLRPAYFVPEAKKVDDLLREMQARSVHMAIVVDEYGGMAGLVTMEDIVEEIVGEIRDEYDQGEERHFQQISENEYMINGRISLDDFNDLLGTKLETDVADTLGGYIYSSVGRVPTGGEKVTVEDWELTVEQVSGRRIRQIRAEKQVDNPETVEDETNIAE